MGKDYVFIVEYRAHRPILFIYSVFTLKSRQNGSNFNKVPQFFEFLPNYRSKITW